jgi:hypothetical protein
MPKSKSLDGVDAELRQRVELVLALVPSAWIASAYRSYAEQKALYDGWKKGLPGYAPANYPGTSMHEKGLAVDIDCADYSLLNRFTKQCGLYQPHKAEPWHQELDPKRVPLDSNVIPSITVRNLGDLDMENIDIHTYSNVELDKDGNGWVFVDAPIDHIHDITQEGSYPPADGYWPICQYAKQARVLGPGKQSVVEITGGKRKQVVTFYVQVSK